MRDSSDFARNQADAQTLHRLNEAVDLYKSEFGPIPIGSNDEAHHRLIINELMKTSAGRHLIDLHTLDIQKLVSVGAGDSFWFTKYQNASSIQPVQKIAKIDPTKPLKVDAWVIDNDGVIETPPSVPKLDTIDPSVNAILSSNVAHGSVTFNKAGMYEWIIPDGVTQIHVESIAGGGSGSKASSYDGWRLERIAIIVFYIEYDFLGGDSALRASINSHKQFQVIGPAKVTNIEKELIPYLPSHRPIPELYSFHFLIPLPMASIEIPSGQLKYFGGRYLLSESAGYRIIETLEHKGIRLESWNSSGGGALSLQRTKLKIERPHKENIQGNGGKAGQYRAETITNLVAGTPIFISVGNGGNGTNGGDTTLINHRFNIACRGGIAGIVPSKESPGTPAGEQTANLGNAGNGGNGQKDFKIPEDLKGVDGCVRITY